MIEMLKREAAVAATRARFDGRPFEWGRVDCARIVAFHLRHLRGVKLGLSKAGPYASALSARRALKRIGHDSLSSVLDANGFQRIAPAQAMLGDIVQVPGTEGWDALTIVLGNGWIYGFHEDGEGAVPMRVTQVGTVEAWRA